MKGKTKNEAFKTAWRLRVVSCLHAYRQRPGWNYLALLVIWLLASGMGYLGLSRNLPSANEWVEWRVNSMAPPNEIRCEGHGGAELGFDSFEILVDSHFHALNVSKAFCDDALFSKSKLDFKVVWGLSEQDSLTHIQRGRSDLVFGKPHLISSFSVQSLQSYEILGYYPSYTSNLISKKPLTLSRRSLVGKRAGFLESTKSRSGRLVPESALREAGVSMGDLVVVYASSHAQLRSLLMSDQVDFIASFWSPEDRKVHVDWEVLPLGGELPGSGWFIHGRHLKGVYSCAAQRVLKQMSDAAESVYFQSLRLVADDC